MSGIAVHRYLFSSKIISTFATKNTSAYQKYKQNRLYDWSAKLLHHTLYKFSYKYPKWRANATIAFLSFHKSEIGIPCPFKSNTVTLSNKLVVSLLTSEEANPVSHQAAQFTFTFFLGWNFDVNLLGYLGSNLGTVFFFTQYRLVTPFSFTTSRARLFEGYECRMELNIQSDQISVVEL